MADVLFHATYIASKQGKTSLAVSVDIDKVERSTGTRTQVVTSGSATEGRNGHYFYRLASVSDLQTHDYIATFKTSDATVDQQHIYSGWFPYPLAYATELAYLDQAVSDTPTVGEITSAISAMSVDGALDMVEVLRLMLAVLVGKSSGGGTATVTFRDSADTKNRVSATVDDNGNRTAITVDPS